MPAGVVLWLMLAGSPAAADGNALFARANDEIARGEIDAAMNDLASALGLADKSGDAAFIRRAVMRIVDAHYFQGRMDRGLAIVNARLERSVPGDPNRAMYLVLRGVGLRDTADFDGARRAFDEAQPLADRSGNLEDIAAVHRARGLLIWRAERKREPAMRELDLAMIAAQRNHARGQVVGILNSIGNVLRGSAVGDRTILTEALQRYSEALAISREMNDPGNTSMLLKNIGDVHRILGDADPAEASLTEAIAVADRSATVQIQWMARMFLGMLERDRDPARADRAFGEALDVLEHEANLMALGDLHAGRLAAEVNVSDNPFEQYIDFLVSTNHADRAFDIAERERARVLLDALAAGSETVAGDAPSAFPSAEREILGRIKAAQATLRAGTATDVQRQDLAGRIDREERALSDLRLRLAVDRPALARARYPKLLRARDVQTSLLGTDESIASFFLGANRSFAWIATSDRLEAIRLPPRRTIEGAVRAALKQLRDPAAADRSAIDALGRTLSIDDVVRRASTSRLV